MGNTKGMSRDICVILTQGAVSIKILDVMRRLNLRLDLLSTLGTLPRERNDSMTGTRCTSVIKCSSTEVDNIIRQLGFVSSENSL